MGINNLSTGEKIGIAAGAAALVGGAAVVGGMIASRRKRKKISHTKRGLKQDRARRSKQKWEVAYRKKSANQRAHHRRGTRKVYYARKTGQPYIILANGQAKFIKGKRRKR